LFYYYPYDPSAFDTIQFYDYSQDPGGAGIASRVWDFGNGTTSTAQDPTHGTRPTGITHDRPDHPLLVQLHHHQR
jgi:PKD repeat protein